MKPKIGDKYFNHLGWCLENIYEATWHNDKTDNYLFSIGNCFKTKEEALTAQLERQGALDPNKYPLKYCKIKPSVV